MKHVKVGVAALATLSLGACSVPNGPFPVEVGPKVTQNVTPYEDAFACTDRLLAEKGRHLRIAVGQVKDYTGKFTNEAQGGGYKITQGGALMVMSALGKLDPRYVEQTERFDTSIPDVELTLSKSQLVRDGNAVRVPRAGQIDGSDYYIVGGITELNYNIASGGAELNITGVGAGARYFVMNVAADLRIVDTKTLEVVKTVSLQKQIVGQEVEANIFRFFGNQLVDFNAGDKHQEPLQLGVRSTLEAGVLELVTAADGVNFTPCRATVEAKFAKSSDRKPQPAAPSAAAYQPKEAFLRNH
jgi:curli biogenesis system outer membrane secretion channel CsgG